MFTQNELEIIQDTEVDDIRDVIQAQLNVLMTTHGAIDIRQMDKREVDFAIHLLRQFRALMPDVSAEQKVA